MKFLRGRQASFKLRFLSDSDAGRVAEYRKDPFQGIAHLVAD